MPSRFGERQRGGTVGCISLGIITELPGRRVACRQAEIGLEHYPYSYTRLSGVLNQALASSEEMSVSASVIAVSRVSLDRALAERSSCLSLAQAFSMGFKSGE